MKIIIANTAGFCFGVKYALNKVLSTANKVQNTVYTDGPLIHNPQVIDILRQRNIKVLDDNTDISNATVVIRAHGVSPKRYQFLKSSCLQLVDGTCPLVSKIHNIVSNEIKKGRKIIIIGEDGHPEVIGILGYTDGNGIVINSVEEIVKIPFNKDDYISVVAQSTQEVEHFEKLVNEIKKIYKNIEVFDTICNETKKRQIETEKLAQIVDLMVIVGGKNSGNTKRLVQVAQKYNTPSILIETTDELNPNMFENVKIVGITAGASTPNWMIRNTAQKIEEIAYNKNRFFKIIRKFLNFLIDSNIYIGICAFLMAFVAFTLVSKTIHIFEASLLALYIFAMHTFNRYIDQNVSRYKSPTRNELYHKYPKFIIFTIVFSILLVLFLSLNINIWLFLFYLFCSLAGLLYSISFVPIKFKPYIKYASIKDIPGSRDIFLSFGWAFVLTFSPIVSGKWVFEWRLFFTFSIIFILMLCRTITLDIKDIQGDSIIGKETIPTLIGSKNSVILIKVLLLLASLITIFAVVINEYEYYCLSLLLNYAYMLFIINKFGNESNHYGNYVEGLIDFNFILAAINLFVIKYFFTFF